MPIDNDLYDHLVIPKIVVRREAGSPPKARPRCSNTSWSRVVLRAEREATAKMGYTRTTRLLAEETTDVDDESHDAPAPRQISQRTLVVTMDA